MAKAYSYARWSDARQGQGSTEERQLSSTQQYAAEHGLELDNSLVDRGLSGFTGANRQKGDLGRFLQMVRDGVVQPGDYLLLDSMDRLSRLPADEAAHQLLGLTLAGIIVVTMNDRAVYRRGAQIGELINALLRMEGAHNYSLELGRKVARGHSASKRKAREEGRVYSKTGPGWLRLNAARSEWLKIPERVAVVQQVFDWADNHGLGCRVIAQKLNAEGIAPFRQGTGWHDVAVTKLLKNRMVLGEYQPRFRDGTPDGEPIQGYYGEGIISPDQFHRIQARMGSANRHRGPRRGNGLKSFNNLFAGICECNACGSTVGVHIRSKDQLHQFLCRNTAKGHLCANRRRYRVKEFEQAVLRHVAEIDLTAPQPAERLERSQSLADQRAKLADKVKRLLSMRLEEGDDPHIKEAYHSAVAELERVDRKISAELAKQPAHKSQAAIKSLMTGLDQLSGSELYERRAAISHHVKAIVDFVIFDTDGSISVGILGGALTYVFKDGKLEARQDFTCLAEAEPELAAKMVHGDQAKLRKMRELAAA
jgi:hypothetical protein